MPAFLRQWGRGNQAGEWRLGLARSAGRHQRWLEEREKSNRSQVKAPSFHAEGWGRRGRERGEERGNAGYVCSGHADLDGWEETCGLGAMTQNFGSLFV